jgi:hypothetical protein
MRKPHLTGFQLLLLLAAVVLVVWSRSGGSHTLPGTVVLDDLKEGKLYARSLQVDKRTRVVISQDAAFESDAGDAPLAAYGWINRRPSNEAIWTPDVSKLVRGTIIQAIADTIYLDPGQYEVFYTTLGPTSDSRRNAPFLGLTPYWTNRIDKLTFVLSVPGNETDSSDDIREIDASPERRAVRDLFWDSGSVQNSASFEQLIDVRKAGIVHAYAIGEMCSKTCDIAWIEDALTGQRVWEMTWDNTRTAGGMNRNRVFSGAITLERGIYRAVFVSNASHSSGHWIANPPLDPNGWGIQLYGADPGSMSLFDVNDSGTKLISIRMVGNNASELRQIRVKEQTNVIIEVLGEISTSGTLYDYAWLEQNESREKVWAMSLEKSTPAGGSSTNRKEEVILALSPGYYTLHYQTDESHSFGSWEKPEPDNPERWGVELFTLGSAAEGQASVEVIADASSVAPTYSENALPGADIPSGSDTPPGLDTTAVLLVDMSQVGNDADLSQEINLTAETELRIEAQGEISTQGRYDYGWIEDAASGQRVWEMTLSNTTPAGGEDRNRRFEGTIVIPAGDYLVHFVSDFSHAYGDFNDGPPAREDEWGLRIFARSM